MPAIHTNANASTNTSAAPADPRKYYEVYRSYYFKFGHDWAQKVGKFEKRKADPFSRVTQQVNNAMRRYLGADSFTKYINLMEYMILKEGLLVKTGENKIDITKSTFELWLV